MKVELLFGSNFHSRSERNVTNAQSVVYNEATAAVGQLTYQ